MWLVLLGIMLAGKRIIVITQKEREGPWSYDGKVVGGTIILSRGQPCNFFFRFTGTVKHYQRGRNWNQKAPVAEQNQAVEKQKFKRCGFVWTE